MKNKILPLSLLAVLPLCVPVDMEAKVQLPAYLTDSMVIQRNDIIKLSGKADGPVTVRASWSPSSLTTVPGKDRSFLVELPTPEAGGPFEITISDKDSERKLSQIYSGEVWLCSGQSNMEMPVGGWGKVMNYQQEIASANEPDVHLLQISKETAFSPADDVKVNMGGWRTANPSTVENFSALAYFYARQLARELGVHVGVIDCDWGGTPAEAWTSLEGVKSIPGFEEQTLLLEQAKGDPAKMEAGYEKMVQKWFSSIKEEPYTPSATPAVGWPEMPIPGEWENSVLPGFDGIVWLQRSFEIPASWAGKPLTLKLGMIDDEDITYFNGKRIATGSGYNVQRDYTVPGKLVKPGNGVITIRVSDFSGEGGITGSPSDLSVSCGDESIPLAGNWSYKVAADFSKTGARPASVSGSSYPTVLYNAMLYPLRNLPLKGVLWYQGCANVGRHEQYSPLFRRLISDWRQLWERPDLPFYFVQLAGYLKPETIQPDSQWAALRQAQADALVLPNTAMVTAIDLGNPDDIHPKNKQEVARRLCHTALRHSYGRTNVTSEAPVLVSSDLRGKSATLTFDADVYAGGVPAGFIVMSPQGVWSRPQVNINGRVVTLTSSDDIRQIKYNWADFPDGNLRGANCLPVVPFSL